MLRKGVGGLGQRGKQSKLQAPSVPFFSLVSYEFLSWVGMGSQDCIVGPQPK